MLFESLNDVLVLFEAEILLLFDVLLEVLVLVIVDVLWELDSESLAALRSIFHVNVLVVVLLLASFEVTVTV